MSQNCDQRFTVSVVIPAYNAEQYIRRALDSVLSQTWQAGEIIVVDDGSTDRTEDILKYYSDKIIYIRQSNFGASVARNTGIERATGNWIAFLDADDQWLPTKLEMQNRHLQDNSDLVWTYGNYWIFDSHGKSRKLAFISPPAIIKGEIIPDYLIVHSVHCIRTSTLVVTKKALLEAGLFVPDLKWEDTDIFLKIAYNHPCIGYLGDPLINYQNDSDDSLTSRDRFCADKRCELIERHLKLSRQYNRQREFITCASEKVSYWISVALQYKQYKEARIMIRKLGYLIPSRRRMELAMQAFLPYIGTEIVREIFFLKQFFRKFIK
jgi:glycosyltransferase involved in cell wall biosynthesis